MFVDIAYAMGPPAEGAQQGGGMGPLITMALVFFIFYFLLIRPQQKRAKDQVKFLDSINKGDSVITNGGILGKIVGITEKVITLEVGENSRVKVLKSAISGLQKDMNGKGK